MLDLYRMSATPNPRTILKIDEVLRRTGLKTTGLYDRIKNRTFPAQVSLGARAVGWYEDEVQDWIDQRPATDAARNGRNGENTQGTWPNRRSEHQPMNRTDREPAALVETANHDLASRSPEPTLEDRRTSDVRPGRQNAIAAPNDARGPEELKRLRAENSRLTILIANLMLENDALRSATV